MSTHVYLIQTALITLNKKIRKKKLLRKRNYVKLESMFSKHEYLLNIDYFVIPELNVEASAYNAVFAQIIVKR